MKTTTFNHGGKTTITVSHDLGKLIGKLDQARPLFAELGLKYTKSHIAPLFIRKIHELMLAGGSKDSRFSWGYWERKRGGTPFVYKKGKATSFSYGWKGKGVKRYPIHPRSYLKRKNRRKPVAGQFALYDTGKLFNSFQILSAFRMYDRSEIAIGSTDKKLDFHELAQGKVPKRQIMAPVADWFNSNTALHKKIMNDICKELSERLAY